MILAFLSNIPQPTDQLSISQGNILNNFTILGAIAGNTNASSASINATSGFNWIYLPPQGAIPPAGAAFTAGNIGLYSASNPTTTENELYINKTNQVTVVQIPSTASTLSVNSAPAAFSSGFTYLPSGLILKWGHQNGNGLTNVQVNGLANQPNFAGMIMAWASPESALATDANNAVRIVGGWNIPVNNFFQVFCSPRITTGAGNAGICWLALGY